MRVIAATNVPLRELVAAGQMRSDIYYRLNVISIGLIPLRQRLQDIPLLVQDFLHHHRISLQKKGSPPLYRK
jgi:transcriptional regulator with PAS, ATPase and Fis domain